jgi:hypothetical protein
MIIKALREEPLPVYGDGMNVRDWIHVDDHCGAIVAALFEGKSGTVYNFGGNHEMTNLDLVRMILDRLGKPHSLISFVSDRPGHDRRYAIDSSFAQRELDWKPSNGTWTIPRGGNRFSNGPADIELWRQSPTAHVIKRRSEIALLNDEDCNSRHGRSLGRRAHAGIQGLRRHRL